jgi:hypothetical protein
VLRAQLVIANLTAQNLEAAAVAAAVPVYEGPGPHPEILPTYTLSAIAARVAATMAATNVSRIQTELSKLITA